MVCWFLTCWLVCGWVVGALDLMCLCLLVLCFGYGCLLFVWGCCIALSLGWVWLFSVLTC